MSGNVEGVRVQTAINNLPYVTGGSHDHPGLVRLADDMIAVCKQEQKFIRKFRGQLRAVFNDYQSPDHLYNAAVVLDMVREKCQSLVHGIAPKLGSAVQSVEIFKPNALRYDALIRMFSNVCRQIRDHKEALSALAHLLVKTRGMQEGAIFGEMKYHIGTTDPDRLQLVADAYRQRADQEQQAGRLER